MTYYPDVMIDIETTGTNPAYNQIIQIAAVRFNFAERTIDTTSMFDMTLAPAPNRFWDEDCRVNFWGKMPDLLRELQARAQPPHWVLQEWIRWVRETPIERGEYFRFWSKPTTFDWAFLASYCQQFDEVMPFAYYKAVDVNSFIRGLTGDPDGDVVYRQFEGTAHNALIDVINQIGNVFAAADQLRGPKPVVEEAVIVG